MFDISRVLTENGLCAGVVDKLAAHNMSHELIFITENSIDGESLLSLIAEIEEFEH